MIGKTELSATLAWSANQRQVDQFDQDFYGEPEPEPISAERREMLDTARREKFAEAKLRQAALIDSSLRHTFGDDREFYVAGMKVYKNDVKILYKPVVKSDGDHVGGKRRPIESRTARSRKKLSFTVSNTDTVIVGMIVLTWQVAPMDGKIVKRQLGDLFDAIRREWKKKIEWLWWLEFHESGSPHIHILTAGEIHAELSTVRRRRKGKMKTIYCGAKVDWLWKKWLRIIGAADNEKSIRFNRGGIWEKMDKPDGAARYCAKEAWKPHQTKVPKKYSNVGAWWHRSRGFKTPEMQAELLAGEKIIRAGLKISEGEKLHPVLFGKTKELKEK